PFLPAGLREHLLAAGAGQPVVQQQSVASGPPSAHTPEAQSHHHIDPAIAGSGYPMSAGEIGDGNLSESGRKGRRELSTSKRAAQNRAAQRAFRQRKEEYIKSLKDQVDDYKIMAENFKAVQSENYQLRDYIISLQSRLLESQGNYPEPPSNIDLSSPHGSANPNAQLQQEQAQHQQQNAQQQQHSPLGAPTAPMSSSAAHQLQQAAAQAAAAQATTELNNGAKHGRSHEDMQYMPASEYPAQKRLKSEEATGMTSVQDAGGNADHFLSMFPRAMYSQPQLYASHTATCIAPEHSALPAYAPVMDSAHTESQQPQQQQTSLQQTAPTIESEVQPSHLPTDGPGPSERD
ncbi:hypothetical protein K490DRAFT_43976, partial [Saccharata proteae CBS 121410]